MTQEGTNIYALNSDRTGTINYDIANDLNIIASKDTYSYTEKTSTKHAGISVGTKIDSNMALNGLNSALDLGGGNVSNKVKSTTYNNVDIIANNINIKTGNNTDIKGANVLAQATTDNSNNTIGGNINIDIGNNLNIESLQDSYYAKSKSSNFGISAGGGSSGASAGFNFGKTNSTTDSQWVSQQTSIIGDNNVNIKTNNNTNLIGSVVASNTNNLILNTNSLTYQDLNDFYTSTTKGNGLTTNIGTSSDSFFKGIAPNGTTTITLVNSGEDKKQNTRATIGNGNIIITDNSDISDLNRNVATSQNITQDQITGALNGTMQIDNRIFGAIKYGDKKTYETDENGNPVLDENGNQKVNTQKEFGVGNGWKSIYSDVRNVKKNTHIATAGALEETYNLGGKYLNNVVSYVDEKLGDTNSIIGSGLQTLISPVVGTSNFLFESRSYLKTKDGIVDNASMATNYYGNGIQNSEENIEEVLNMKNTDTVARYNPDSSGFADVVESTLGKAFNLIGFGGVSRMSRLEAQDFYDRKDMTNVNNVSHSQGTIIMTGALQYYADRYGTDSINSTQNFVFTGPAVNKGQTKDVVENIGINTQKEGQGLIYEHDKKDPVNYITNINKIPEGTKRGINGELDFKSHTFINNYDYYKYLLLDYNNQTPINKK